MGISSSTNRRRPNHDHLPNSSNSPYPVANPYYYYQSELQGLGYASQEPPYQAVDVGVYGSVYRPFDACSYVNPVGYYQQHFSGQMNQWGMTMTMMMMNGVGVGRVPAVVMAHPAPPYVEHQNAKRVRSCVNLHKDSLRLVEDELNPGHYLVAFVFDALQDGSITIQYFAKEDPYCRFISLFTEACPPLRIPFLKGLAQSFRQPSGTGINLSFFEPDALSKPSAAEDIFPLLISAETYIPPDDLLGAYIPNSSPNTQITQATFVKSCDDTFQVRVTRQILWIDGVRYELKELYGMGNSSGDAYENDNNKDCVICMTEPKDTAVLPCRHMCMCGECAQELRLQSDKCPICRQAIEELLEIKVSDGSIYR